MGFKAFSTSYREDMADPESFASEPTAYSRRPPWATRFRHSRNPILRSLSWIWSNPITIAIPSQIHNRQNDIRHLLGRLKHRS